MTESTSPKLYFVSKIFSYLLIVSYIKEALDIKRYVEISMLAFVT